MPSSPPDVLYVYALLGVGAKASFEATQGVWEMTQAYRFTTKDRRALVQKMTDFLAARDRFGGRDASFEALRKAYHRKAFLLHPDRHPGDTLAEERLKSLNGAWRVVQDLQRETKAWLGLPPAERKARESEAQSALAAAAPKPHKAQKEQKQEPPRSASAQGLRYMAASIPRFIRYARLAHLPAHAVIGSWQQGTLTYDVVMLAEKEFHAARTHLASAAPISAHVGLQSLIAPAFAPRDTKSFVPLGKGPAAIEEARAFFKQAFHLA